MDNSTTKIVDSFKKFATVPPIPMLHNWKIFVTQPSKQVYVVGEQISDEGTIDNLSSTFTFTANCKEDDFEVQLLDGRVFKLGNSGMGSFTKEVVKSMNYIIAKRGK